MGLSSLFEQRQLITLSIAVLLFSMTVFAHYVYNSPSRLVRIGITGDQSTSGVWRRDGSANYANGSVARATTVSRDLVRCASLGLGATRV
jgi:hypothetical protein